MSFAGQRVERLLSLCWESGMMLGPEIADQEEGMGES